MLAVVVMRNYALYTQSLYVPMIILKAFWSVFSRHLAETPTLLPMQTDDAINMLRETMSSFMLEY